jgi:hypothetical protein
MNLFQFIEDVEAGQFFVSAVHDGSNVINIAIYPVVDDIVYPALLMDLQAMQPLIEMIEGKLAEAA